MDIGDCLNHPFKIECPAELVNDMPDVWKFTFDNGCVAYVGDNDACTGRWGIVITTPSGESVAHENYTDENNAITDLLEHFAHLATEKEETT